MSLARYKRRGSPLLQRPCGTTTLRGRSFWAGWQLGQGSVGASAIQISDMRCGARMRKGTPCQRRTYPNGRCRNHGGLCTGPGWQIADRGGSAAPSRGPAVIALLLTLGGSSWVPSSPSRSSCPGGLCLVLALGLLGGLNGYRLMRGAAWVRRGYGCNRRWGALPGLVACPHRAPSHGAISLRANGGKRGSPFESQRRLWTCVERFSIAYAGRAQPHHRCQISTRQSGVVARLLGGVRRSGGSPGTVVEVSVGPGPSSCTLPSPTTTNGAQ